MPPADGHNTTGEFLPSAHGFSGPLLTSLPGFPTPIDQRILNATSQVDGFPFNIDMNRGDETGIGKLLDVSMYLAITYVDFSFQMNRLGVWLNWSI